MTIINMSARGGSAFGGKTKFVSLMLLAIFAALTVITPVFADEQQTTTSTSTEKPIKTIKKLAPVVDPVCMQTAIEKRDTTMITAVDTSASAIKTGLQVRKDALKTAWGISDKKARRVALVKAWKDWEIASKKGRKDLRIGRDAAWKQFNTDKKACGTSGSSDDPGNAGKDSQL